MHAPPWVSGDYSRGIYWHGNCQQAHDHIHQSMGKVCSDEVEFVILSTVLVTVVPGCSDALGARDCEQRSEPGPQSPPKVRGWWCHRGVGQNWLWPNPILSSQVRPEEQCVRHNCGTENPNSYIRRCSIPRWSESRTDAYQCTRHRVLSGIRPLMGCTQGRCSTNWVPREPEAPRSRRTPLKPAHG